MRGFAAKHSFIEASSGAMRHAVGLLPMLLLVCALLVAPGNATSCRRSMPPYMVCWSAPSNGITSSSSNATLKDSSAECTAIRGVLSSQSLPANTVCGLPESNASATLRQGPSEPQAMVTQCFSTSNVLQHARVVAATLQLSDKASFSAAFTGIYTQPPSLWAYCSCRPPSGVPDGFAEDGWLLVFTEKGAYMAPPPPLPPSSRQVLVVSGIGAGAGGSRRRQLSDTWPTSFDDQLGHQSLFDSVPAFLSNSQHEQPGSLPASVNGQRGSGPADGRTQGHGKTAALPQAALRRSRQQPPPLAFKTEIHPKSAVSTTTASGAEMRSSTAMWQAAARFRLPRLPSAPRGRVVARRMQQQAPGAPPPSPPPDYAGPCFVGYSYQPLNLPGYDRTVESDAAACSARCAATPGCAYFNYWGDGGCHVSGPDTTLTEDTDVAAGPPGCNLTASTTPTPTPTPVPTPAPTPAPAGGDTAACLFYDANSNLGSSNSPYQPSSSEFPTCQSCQAQCADLPWCWYFAWNNSNLTAVWDTGSPDACSNSGGTTSTSYSLDPACQWYLLNGSTPDTVSPVLGDTSTCQSCRSQCARAAYCYFYSWDDSIISPISYNDTTNTCNTRVCHLYRTEGVYQEPATPVWGDTASCQDCRSECKGATYCKFFSWDDSALSTNLQEASSVSYADACTSGFPPPPLAPYNAPSPPPSPPPPTPPPPEYVTYDLASELNNILDTQVTYINLTTSIAGYNPVRTAIILQYLDFAAYGSRVAAMSDQLTVLYPAFVKGGGIVILQPRLQLGPQSFVTPQQSCDSTLVLLKALLGDGRMASCSCVTDVPAGAVAMLNTSAASAVLGADATQTLANTQGVDYMFSLDIVSGLPLVCNTSDTYYGGEDMYPVFLSIMPNATMPDGNSTNSTNATDAAPPQPRCQMYYNDATPCPYGGDFASCSDCYSRTFNSPCDYFSWDGSAPQNLGQGCMNDAPPLAPPMSPSAPPAPPPTGLVFTRTIDASTPAGYRDATCDDVAQDQAAAVAVTRFLDICSIEGGVVYGPRDGYDSGLSSQVQCPGNSTDYYTDYAAAQPLGYACRILVVNSSDAAPIVEPDLLPYIKTSVGNAAPLGARLLTCEEATLFAGDVAPLLSGDDVCQVAGGIITVQPNATSNATDGSTQDPLVLCSADSAPQLQATQGPNCVMYTTSDVVVVRSSLVKAWRLGAGWVVYLGGQVLAEDTPYVQDRSVWHQLFSSLSRIVTD